MTGTVGRRATVALAVAALLCACQPKPVEGTVVDKYTYPDGGQAVCVDGPGDRPVCSTPVQPTGYYVSIRSDADGPSFGLDCFMCFSTSAWTSAKGCPACRRPSFTYP